MAAGLLGADPKAIAEVAGISADALGDPNARIPHDQVAVVWEQAARATGNDAIGITIAELNQRSRANALTFAVVTSPTLAHGFACISRYVHLIHDAVLLEVSIEGELARATWKVAPGVRAHRHGVEFALAQVALTCFDDSALPLREVTFRHTAPAATGAHERVFRTTPRFDADADALIFDRELLDRPLAQRDPALHTHLVRHLEQRMLELDAEQSLRARAKKLVISQLPSGVPDIDEIARRLKLGGRTLQRKLREEGTSLQEVVNDVRRETAILYLRDATLSLGEVAFLLGYTEQGNFHRAFKRWTGMTPAQARRGAAPA
jgi:AraC-like DNA-binding protein